MGLFFGMLAALLGASKDIVSKKLSVSVDATTSTFASFFFALPFYVLLLGILWFIGLEDFSYTPLFLTYIFARSLSDTLAESFKMHALARGDLSIMTAVISMHPVITLVTSPWITGDPLTLPIVIGVLVAVTGSLVILYKGSGTTSRAGILCALGCALFMSVNNCFDRLSVQTASAPFSAFLMTALAGLFLLPPMFFANRAPFLRLHAKPFLLRGFFEVVFMTVKLTALQYIQAPELSAIMRTQLLFAVIGGGVIFKEVNIFRKLLGAFLTLAGLLIILLAH